MPRAVGVLVAYSRYPTCNPLLHPFIWHFVDWNGYPSKCWRPFTSLLHSCSVLRDLKRLSCKGSCVVRSNFFPLSNHGDFKISPSTFQHFPKLGLRLLEWYCFQLPQHYGMFGLHAASLQAALPHVLLPGSSKQQHFRFSRLCTEAVSRGKA